MGIINTFDAWGVLEIKVISKPTPIWGGVNGMVVNRNFKVSDLFFTTNDGASISLGISSTSIAKITIGKMYDF